MTDPIAARAEASQGWRASSHSNSEGGSCLEVLDGHPAGVPVRDSKVPDGPALVFGAGAWSPFVSALKAGFPSWQGERPRQEHQLAVDLRLADRRLSRPGQSTIHRPDPSDIG